MRVPSLLWSRLLNAIHVDLRQNEKYVACVCTPQVQLGASTKLAQRCLVLLRPCSCFRCFQRTCFLPSYSSFFVGCTCTSGVSSTCKNAFVTFSVNEPYLHFKATYAANVVVECTVDAAQSSLMNQFLLTSHATNLSLTADPTRMSICNTHVPRQRPLHATTFNL